MAPGVTPCWGSGDNQWNSASPPQSGGVACLRRAPRWAVQPALVVVFKSDDAFLIIHFSTYLFYLTLFFRSLHDSRVYFQTFPNLPWNMLSSQLPLQISIWNQWLFTRQNWCELGFCTFFLRPKAPVGVLHVRRSIGPTWRQHPSCEALLLTEASQSGPHHTVLEQGFENSDVITTHGAACKVRPCCCFMTFLAFLFSYLVNLSWMRYFFFSSPRKAMVRCSWKRTLGNHECPELVLCRLLRTAVLFHIWSISPVAMFSCLSPDVLCLGEGRPSCETGNI